jgi:hypothetical protein
LEIALFCPPRYLGGHFFNGLLRRSSRFRTQNEFKPVRATLKGASYSNPIPSDRPTHQNQGAAFANFDASQTNLARGEQPLSSFLPHGFGAFIKDLKTW